MDGLQIVQQLPHQELRQKAEELAKTLAPQVGMMLQIDDAWFILDPDDMDPRNFSHAHISPTLTASNVRLNLSMYTGYIPEFSADSILFRVDDKGKSIDLYQDGELVIYELKPGYKSRVVACWTPYEKYLQTLMAFVALSDDQLVA